MEQFKLKKEIQKFNNVIKSEGVLYVNTFSGNVEISRNCADFMQKKVEGIINSDGFKNLREPFATLFNNRDLPDLLTIKNTDESEYIRFIDDKHIIYSVVNKEHINYNKIKTAIKKIAS